MEPVFLSVEEILKIHADQIQRYGGSSGVREISLLESAVIMPQAGWGHAYLHSDLFEMAAAYLFHIVQNHPFIDGNKRTGAVAALMFLKLNGMILHISEETLVETVFGVAQGKIGKAAIAAFFRKGSRRK